MINFLSFLAMTLLVALAAVVPAWFLRPYVPDLVDPGLQQIAAAAWISGMISWWLASMVKRRQMNARRAR